MPTITAQFLDRPIFRVVSEVAAERGVRAFVIGGFVRDCFLGCPRSDIDIVVEGSGIDFALAVGERTHQHVTYFKNFGTAMLHYRGDEVEFVGARRESYRRESRKPIVENGTLEDDQQRRDFTINAMAFSLQREDFGALVDPFGGIRDLNDGIIRTPLDPDTTYSDDPLRMLRAVRFATRLSTPEHPFTIVPESMASMRRMADRLQILSCERIAEELNKMLETKDPARAFLLMDEAGLLPYVLPELLALKGVETVEGRGHKDNFAHSLAVLSNVVQAQIATADGNVPDRVSDYPAIPLEGAQGVKGIAGDRRFVESVVIPDAERATLCVSSQAGCKMGCKFCMTGRGGFHGQLDAADILNQFISIDESEELSNAVFMGMGEPLDNYDAVARAIEVLTAPWGFAWSPKRITLSTIGVLPTLKRFLDEQRCHLAVSLHNPFPEERLEMMPAQKAWDIREVLGLIRQYDFSGQRRVSFEYTMFAGFNDDKRHADALIRLLRGLECRVNLIRFHQIPDFPYACSPDASMEAFRDRLNNHQILCTIRSSRGEDILAACGMLAGQHAVSD